MKMKAQRGVHGIALMGIEYVCDAAGEIDVPDELAFVAVTAGFDYVAPSVPVDDQHADDQPE